MHFFKKKLNSFLLIAIFLIIGVFSYAGISNAQYWVSDPDNCPSSDSATYPGQDCNTLDICGVVSGNIDCYDTSLLNPPVASENNSTTNQDSAGTNANTFNGGYILNCYANDGSVPRCDDSGTWWCDRSSVCYGVNRLTTCTGGAAESYACGTCMTGYTYCDGDYTDGDGCEVRSGITNCAVGSNNNINASCSCVCDTNYYDCDASGAGAGNGCEILNGGSCAVGSLVGTWDGPTCTCVVDKSYFETGTEVSYSSNDPLLWGNQYGDGPLLKMTSMNASTTGGVFYVGNDGKVGIGTSSPSAMLTVGYEVGSQFLVSATGTVLSGTWNGSPIGLAYGGTGVNLSAGTGFLYVSGGLTIASSTIDIGLTNISTGAGLTMNGSTISLDNTGNWAGTFDNFDSTAFFKLSDWYATTSAPQITSMANLVTIGTITSGTWHGGVIDVLYGGTGATTLNDLITLGTHTTGNYISSTTGSDTITITGTLGEGWVPVFSVTDDSITASKLAMSGSGTGNINQVLVADGNGTFSWSDIGTTNGTVREGFAGQLAFYVTDGMTATGTTGLFWDNGNTRLGIGTTTPGAALSVGSTVNNQFLVGATGIITDGTWNGDNIDDDYVASSTYWNAAYQSRIINTTAPITFTGNTIGLDGLYNIPLIASTTNWNDAYIIVNSKYANWDAVAASSSMYNWAYNIVNSNYSAWNAVAASSTFYNTNSNIVNSNYASWNTAVTW
ncbi:TPA: hypothetical protein DEA48_00770, partial [Candidatus Falkowbacteria bacterium]|nr:hypothetical protein [Candidatus Falkowbacteria bacterium]